MWILMADLTLSSRTMIRPYEGDFFSTPTLTRDASTCASTATIKVGQVVQFDIVSETASHRLVRASTAAGHPNLSTNFAGIAAMSDASDGSTLSANGARPLTIWPATPGKRFLFPTKIAGTASTLMGTALALGYDSTLAIHYLAANSTAGDLRVRVTDVINPGDTNGLVVGYFLSTAVSPTVAPR
jgi:hypothetical protein